ncbi:MAG: ATP-binding cassette domain-containing protein [Candidatus Marinimicrobia bacterium]|nr:ATP-binding cassette domain-containing protein [Candidatus Neomarinimicrobiota bacterium]
MIEFQNVTYNHQKDVGVNNLSFSIPENDFTFLIGPTGSGKTTLMRLIYFDLFPQSGIVRAGDYSSNKIKKRKIAYARRDIGMVFQNYQLLEDRNVYDNIALPLHVLGFPAKEITERVEECIDLVKLDGKEKLNPTQLSGGEQQRASLARAIVKDPSILLADEPTGNLDPVSAFELVKLLQEIHETGTTILMASHNYNLIKGRGYRIMELQNGHLRGNG